MVNYKVLGGADDEGFLDTNTSDTTLQWHPCLIKINGDNCRINNLSFEDYPTHGIDCYGKALIVDSCLFIGGRIEHSTTGGTVLMGIRTNTGADSVIMKNNRFIANSKGGKCYSCMFPSGDKFIISNNICEKYHEHAVYAYGNYGSIIDNKFTDVDCIASDIQYFAIYGIIKGNFSIGTEGFIQIMHGKGTIVEGNTVTNCRGGIIVRPYHTVDVDKLPSGLKLLNNFIELTVGTTGSCLSFYVLGTYDISDILISGNTFANGYYTQASQVAASLLIGAGSSENNGIKFLRVENNVIRSGRGAVSWLKGIHNSIFKNNKFISESLNDVASAFSFAINANYVTDTIFEGNEFIDIKSTPTLARAIQLNTGTTNLSVINNNIINYTSNIYLDYDTDAKLIYKRNNRRNYLPLAGTYDNKPNAYAQEYGVGYYDKDNQVPMWWSGVRWKDAEGCYIVLSKSDINTPNKIYKIRFNIDLGGTTLTLPANCTLDFQGGSFSNGTIVGNNTRINAGLQKIFNTDIIISGSWNISDAYAEWFGAKKDGITDDYLSIQKTLDSFKIWKLNKGTYNTTLPIKIGSNTSIYGVNNKTCILQKTGNGTIDDINAILIITSTAPYVSGVNLSLFTLSSAGYNVDYGIYAPQFSNSTLNCIDIWQCKTGIYLTTSWGLIFTQLDISANTRYRIEGSSYGYPIDTTYGIYCNSSGGTSFILNRCYVHGVAFGYYIKGIHKINFSNATVDNFHNTAFHIEGCEGSLNSCGCENGCIKSGLYLMYLANTVLKFENFVTAGVKLEDTNTSATLFTIAYSSIIKLINSKIEDVEIVGTFNYLRLSQASSVEYDRNKTGFKEPNYFADADSVIKVIEKDTIIVIKNAGRKNTTYLGIPSLGSTANRPTSAPVGFCYYDMTITKPIWAKTISENGITWIDATGSTV